MYVFICNFCVWYNVHKEIIMQTATQTNTCTKQTHYIRLLVVSSKSDVCSP